MVRPHLRLLMFPWHTALLLSLFTGAALGSDELPIDALAAAFADNPTVLAAGIDARVEQLQTGHLAPKVAQQTMALVAPLAERVGLATDRARLEDASFRMLDPVTYNELAAMLDRTPEEDAAHLASLMADTEALMLSAGIDGYVTARVKSVYSTHSKLERKNLTLDQVFDRVALRVHVDAVADCYTVRALLESQWPAIEGERDDYIAYPKANGYQSLHTAMQTEPGFHGRAEFQVRTHAMHEFAEGGDAAHWRYKATA